HFRHPVFPCCSNAPIVPAAPPSAAPLRASRSVPACPHCDSLFVPIGEKVSGSEPISMVSYLRRHRAYAYGKIRNSQQLVAASRQVEVTKPCKAWTISAISAQDPAILDFLARNRTIRLATSDGWG